MKYKAIIFDFDGVLFDSEKLHLKTCNEVFASFGFEISEKEYFQHYVGLSDHEMFPIILKKKNIRFEMSQIDTLITQKINFYKDIINKHKFLEGIAYVKNFIQTYVASINHFGICSGSRREEIDIVLDKLEEGELRKYFKVIITSDDVTLGKPSPEGYLLAAKRLDVLPKDCLVIEDTQKGLDAAKNAGMNVVALTTSYDKTYFKNFDFIADSYQEIEEWLKNFC